MGTQQEGLTQMKEKKGLSFGSRAAIALSAAVIIGMIVFFLTLGR